MEHESQGHTTRDRCPKSNTHKVNPLSANITKWSNTLKQFVGQLPTNY